METALTEQTRVVASQDQVSAPVSGETVILDMKEGVYFGLDAVASRVWELVQEPRALGEVANVIVAEFDVERERAVEDLLTFCTELRARGLLEVAPDSPAR